MGREKSSAAKTEKKQEHWEREQIWRLILKKDKQREKDGEVREEEEKDMKGSELKT